MGIRWAGRPRISWGGGENGLPESGLGAGGSARNGFAPRDRYAGLCERMRGKCGKFFPREEEEITAGPAIRVGPRGYIRQRVGQDGHEKQVPDEVFHGEYSSGDHGVWPESAGEIWPVEVRTTGFTL